MGPILFLALLVVPILELWVIVQVAQGIGFLETLALLIAISIAGAWLLKQQGIATWRRLQNTIERGEVPAQEVVDGALILFGGALLLTPGFVTDIVGIVLLLPPTRAILKRSSRRVLARWARRRVPAPARIYTTTATVRKKPAPSSSEALSREAAPRDEDDSPDN
jgi:UPF0716 protein FxsA